ncbi:MAG TPA: hypothetical protein PLX06_12815, partial [Fimbriimonadaceae bacterium]|nr:hypothetical protein [Fimbriimonadaceae bacterium]
MSFWDMGAYAAMALAQTEMGRNSGSSSIAYGGAESAGESFPDRDSRSRSPNPARELPEQTGAGTDLPNKWGLGSLATNSVEFSSTDGLGSFDSNDHSSQDPTTPPAQNPAQTPRPTEPAGFPGPAPRDGRLPAPQSDKPQEIRLIRAERIMKEGDVLKLRGNIHVQYRGYDLYGDELEANVVTNVFILRRRAQVIGRDAVVLGETIIVDFNAESFRAIDSAAEVRPAYFQGMTLDNLYLRGKEIWGTEREIFGHDCDLTTCTYDRPHYFLDSRDINLRVGKRVILRHVKLNILGKVVLHLPYVSIPLDQRRDAYTPEVGRTPEEGYYIKTKWGVPVAGPNDLDAYADYFEKLGLGVGARFRYLSAKSEGYIRAYGIFGDSDTVEI